MILGMVFPGIFKEMYSTKKGLYNFHDDVGQKTQPSFDVIGNKMSAASKSGNGADVFKRDEG